MGSLLGLPDPLLYMMLDGKAKGGRPGPKAEKEKALKSDLSTSTFHVVSPCREPYKFFKPVLSIILSP
jgi:hypothetical protein